MPALLRNSAVVTRELDGEVFLVEPASGEIFHLDPPTAAIWQLLGTPRSEREVLKTLAGVSPQAVALLAEMRQARLLLAG